MNVLDSNRIKKMKGKIAMLEIIVCMMMVMKKVLADGLLLVV